MDEAQDQRPDQDHNGVLLGCEQVRQLGEGGIGVNELCDLRQEVSEETAGQCAHDKRADAAQTQQTAQIAHGAFGLFDLADQVPHEDHQQSVTHVRHHNAVKQHKEGSHQGVGVQGAVSGERVHLSDHIQGSDQLAVFQLYRNLGIFLLGGVLGLPGAGVLFQHPGQRLLIRGAVPALQEEGPVSAHEPFPVTFPLSVLGEPVDGQLNGEPLIAQSGDGGLGIRFAVSGLVQLFVHPTEIFSRRAGDALKANLGEGSAFQHIHSCGELLLVTQQHHILLTLFGTDRHQFTQRRLFLQLQMDGVQGSGGGDDAQDQLGVPGAGGLQREVQILPREIARAQSLELALLSGRAADLREGISNLLCRLKGVSRGLLGIEGLHSGSGPGCKHALFHRVILVQRRQCVLQGGKLR